MEKILSSSSNPNKLSLTIKGLLVGLPAVLIAVFQMLNVEISEAQVSEVIQNLSAMIAMVVSMSGALRKMWNAIKEA